MYGNCLRGSFWDNFSEGVVGTSDINGLFSHKTSWAVRLLDPVRSIVTKAQLGPEGGQCAQEKEKKKAHFGMLMTKWRDCMKKERMTTFVYKQS
jgi:hypothetical protein